jgi:hypothetical protein
MSIDQIKERRVALFGLFGVAPPCSPKQVANEFLLYRGMVNESKSYKELVAKLNSHGDELSYADAQAETCGWFGITSLMAYHAKFKFAGESVSLQAEGKEVFFGIIFSWSEGDDKIAISLIDSRATQIGKKAAWLKRELLRFPQFWDLNDRRSYFN